ncbi:MAG: hypothetical protein KDH15_08105 [Rhodocyclaceae bacterium]|nr:hypothetical protein [Rhodocyclaceae bacterium]
MLFTDFLPAFLVMALFAFKGPRAWLAVTAIAAFFQAATPIVLGVGGRAAGLAPAYALLPIGVWHGLGLLFRMGRAPRGARPFAMTGRFGLLALFTAIGVFGAVAYPRLFQGLVSVLPPREGLDSGIVVPLRPSGSNYIQSFYLVCNFTIAALVYLFHQQGAITIESFRRFLWIGGTVSVAFGCYQLLAHATGLPWPASFVNSNIGVAQLPEQTVLGVRRMSATFLEPSMMSLHFLVLVGAFVFGSGRLLQGMPFVFALLVSTSSLAYFGLVALVIVWSLLDSWRTGARVVRPLLVTFACCVLAVTVDQVLFDGEMVERLVFNKFVSGSGLSRITADQLAVDTFVQTWGLGAGVGSARASSFLATLLATVGLPGTAAFLALVGSIVSVLARDRSENAGFVIYGVLGGVLAWFLSVPDMAMPLVWLFIGFGMQMDVARRPFAALRTRMAHS